MIHLMPAGYYGVKKNPAGGRGFFVNLAGWCLAFGRHISGLRAFGAVLHVKSYCLTFCE